MGQFEKWVGTWEGSGWQMAGETKQEFKAVETIRRHSGGSVYSIEAKHWFEEEGKPNRMIFDIIGLFTFDRNTGKRFLTMYMPNGAAPSYEISMKENGFSWNVGGGGAGSIDMSLEFNGNQWLEKGFVKSEDARVQIFEMNMTRKQN